MKIFLQIIDGLKHEPCPIVAALPSAILGFLLIEKWVEAVNWQDFSLDLLPSGKILQIRPLDSVNSCLKDVVVMQPKVVPEPNNNSVYHILLFKLSVSGINDEISFFFRWE